MKFIIQHEGEDEDQIVVEIALEEMKRRNWNEKILGVKKLNNNHAGMVELEIHDRLKICCS